MYVLKSNETLRVFILHWNRPDECARTVGCYTKEVQPSAVTVIDNDSTRDNVEKLKGMLPEGIWLIALKKSRLGRRTQYGFEAVA
jgi:hypothetical protein